MKISLRIIKWIKHLIALKCPDCGSDMAGDMYNSIIDKVIYTCTKCGKQWI